MFFEQQVIHLPLEFLDFISQRFRSEFQTRPKARECKPQQPEEILSIFKTPTVKQSLHCVASEEILTLL